ncbi:GNAT family N-acetyltransferase [Flavobacterium johnsoniae]|jgi:diamine N-acetyltransferase|uniref:Diamine N-acetyltransferase n=2 Tax=Flavobacterium johnsoniae TaxID=986 RepID=A0A1M6WH78_FLAJO|nr:GNAT family protein [Flavobacterium johnsoniae]ABQ03055.1 GCN5-related N-acetyltransferase [Flavobacterium johnsoniae UW101]OXG02147.1 GNAT family N-acetyltransferase [Flavobacterium johnsoniae UW101]WQG80082.1 GNAT family protein [Flavobacterium johnsoniae UW101]SHG42967.1 diamine N-acetyltransferase [Flavobacterium johnsoniae]SHK93031.1 diamine N-acetyltransferase [Flavobacterium johnsoniae]
MITLKGDTIYLRALEPEDLEFVYGMENDQSIWEVSNTNTPYSRFLIRQYLENAQQDIYEAKQLRLAICQDQDFPAIGLIDLFEFDPRNNRAGIGIVIQKDENKRQNIGSEALELLIKYSFFNLNLHQLYANISTKNEASIALFTKFGFEKIGIKKDWILLNNQYHDEAIFQLINKNI